MTNIVNYNRKNIVLDTKLLKKVEESEEYKQNQMQIDCIKKVLVEHGDVPEKLIDWLIESVKNNIKLEYTAIKEIN